MFYFKWLMLFCISSPLIRHLVWAPKPVYRRLKASGYPTEYAFKILVSSHASFTKRYFLLLLFSWIQIFSDNYYNLGNISFVLKIALTLSWRRSLSYRNESIDFLSKSMNWFLYDRDLRHERVKKSFQLHVKYFCCVSLKTALSLYV